VVVGSSQKVGGTINLAVKSSTSPAGSVSIFAGSVKQSAALGGNIRVSAGASQVSTGGGALLISMGTDFEQSTSGTIVIGSTPSTSSGAVKVMSSQSEGANSGNLKMATGDGIGGGILTGSFFIGSGNSASSSVSSGSLTIKVGESNMGGGSISMKSSYVRMETGNAATSSNLTISSGAADTISGQVGFEF